MDAARARVSGKQAAALNLFAEESGYNRKITTLTVAVRRDGLEKSLEHSHPSNGSPNRKGDDRNESYTAA